VSRSSIDAEIATYAAFEMRDPARMGPHWVPVLESVPLFAGLSRRHLRRVAALARSKRFAAGTTVMRAGDPGNSFYVILEGSARVVPVGRRPIRRRAGEFFGEMALLDGAPRSADVTAEEEMLTMTIGRSAFMGLLRSEPSIALAIMRTLAERLREAQRSL
jgi:CRP/FNR family transcriptional regulator, cyclic AMP receptor protein